MLSAEVRMPKKRKEDRLRESERSEQQPYSKSLAYNILELSLNNTAKEAVIHGLSGYFFKRNLQSAPSLHSSQNVYGLRIRQVTSTGISHDNQFAV